MKLKDPKVEGLLQKRITLCEVDFRVRVASWLGLIGTSCSRQLVVPLFGQAPICLLLRGTTFDVQLPLAMVEQEKKFSTTHCIKENAIPHKYPVCKKSKIIVQSGLRFKQYPIHVLVILITFIRKKYRFFNDSLLLGQCQFFLNSLYSLNIPNYILVFPKGLKFC